MDRPITFRRVTAGHYINDETGVEIRRNGRTRLGRGGWRAAGWTTTSRHLTEGELTEDHAPTLAKAKEYATRVVGVIADDIAAAYADAVAEEIDRVARAACGAGYSPRGWEHITEARTAWFRREYRRARAWAHEAQAIFAAEHAEAEQVAAAHAAALAEDAERESAVATCVAEDEAAAYAARQGSLPSDATRTLTEEEGRRSPRRQRFVTLAYDEAALMDIARDERLYGCTHCGDGWWESHPYVFDPAVIVRRRGLSDVAVRCGALPESGRHREHGVNCPAAYGTGECTGSLDCPPIRQVVRKKLP